MAIKPTIGRVVLVHTSAAARDASTQPRPALVAYVWNDRLINVGGFDQNGVPFAHTSLPLLQDDDAAPTHGAFAEWMPYQKAQAVKHDAPSESSGPVSA